jgi:serine/threonine protein kinase
MSAVSPHDPLGILGTTIHEKYLVGKLVGEGGFSVVYKRRAHDLAQPVALKCFKVLGNAPARSAREAARGLHPGGQADDALSSRSAAIVQARDIGTFTTRTASGCRTW